jgi:hypothetical protein
LQGAAGSLIGHVTFARKPGHRCKLSPTVRARILWANDSLAIPVPVIGHLPGDPTPAASSDAQRIAMGLVWRNWCGRGLWGARIRGPLQLSVSFGYGGSGPFAVQLRERPRCDSRESPSRAFSTPFLTA